MTKQTIVLNNKLISIYATKDKTYNKGKTIRRIRMVEDSLVDIPEDLFAVKVSQSKNPNKAGKTVFKYLSYKFGETWEDMAPPTVTIATPVSEIKQIMLDATAKKSDVKYSLMIKYPGDYGHIFLQGDKYALFDNVKFPAKQDDKPDGNPNYYLRNDVPVTITLTPAVSQGNDYYQVKLESNLTPDEVFKKSGPAKVWGEDDDSVSFDTVSEDTVEDNPWA